MKFDLVVPCDNCPFRRSGKAVRLHPERAKEISDVMLSRQGSTFVCHKNSHALGLPKSKPERHCAGALIFAEKNDNATQMMRIAERIGLYDREKLLCEGNKAAIDDIFNTQTEMIKANHGQAD